MASPESSTSRTRRGMVIATSLSLRRRRLVQYEPVQPELLHRHRELDEVHGLADVGVAAQAVAADQVLLFPGRGEDDNGEAAQRLGLAYAPQHFQAVQFGQLQVQENQRRQGARVAAR